MAHGYFAGVGPFFIYFIGGVTFLALFSAIYWKLTAHDELTLIRAGNMSAVVAFLGALIGYAFPLAKSIAQSTTIPDFAVWATIALAVQIAAYYAARLGLRDVSTRITAGDLSAGLWLGGVAVVFGMLNSASMSM